MKEDAEFLCRIASHNAARHRALYEKKKDGLLLWKAYQEFRRCQIGIPDWLLKEFDGIAKRLESASTAKSVAEALQMATRGGGMAGAKRTRSTEYQRDIVEQVMGLLNAFSEDEPNGAVPKKMTRADAYRRVAASTGCSVANVRKYYQDWDRATKVALKNRKTLALSAWKPVTPKE